MRLGPQEIVVLVVLGVLLFGRRLPEVGKSVGKAIKAFQNGWHGIEDDVGSALTAPEPANAGPRPPQRISAAVPKFDNHVDGTPT
jgi:sec-independent protein translocase protein TatA